MSTVLPGLQTDGGNHANEKDHHACKCQQHVSHMPQQRLQSAELHEQRVLFYEEDNERAKKASEGGEQTANKTHCAFILRCVELQGPRPGFTHTLKPPSAAVWPLCLRASIRK